MMKLYLAYIPLFLITYQNIDREKEVPSRYIGSFLGKHELILKENGNFVRRGYNLVPQYKDLIPPPGNMPSPVYDRKKRKYKTKGNWAYFKKGNLDGVLLKTTNQTDSLFFLENENLSPNNPHMNDRNTSIEMPHEFVKKSN